MKALLIEPHPDDILLSCHEYALDLAFQGYELHYISVTDGGGNGGWHPRSAREYATLINSKTFEEFKLTDDGMSKDAKRPWREYMVENSSEVIVNKVVSGNSYYSEWMDNFSRKLSTSYESIQPSIVLCPIGLRHPTHVFVSYATHRLLGPGRVQYYVDHPYDAMKSGQYQMDDTIRVRNLSRVCLYSERDVDHLKKLFTRLYPTEWVILRGNNAFRPVDIYE
jgi:LmbE family N-acetylglucosaminyl deacetylase